MKEFQQTLSQSFQFSGIGLHSGLSARVIVEPAKVNFGFRFQRTDLADTRPIRANIANVYNTDRSTNLASKEVKVHTVEHLLAALTGCGIDNALIKIDNLEVPILDGSAAEIVALIEAAGIEKQDAERVYFPLDKTIHFYDAENDVDIMAVPFDEYCFQTQIGFSNSTVLHSQYANLSKMSDFASEIAPARTFCFLEEIEQLLANDLIKGGTLDSAIVYADKKLDEKVSEKLSAVFGVEKIAVEGGTLNNTTLRFGNEAARHKLLDLVGDLSLLGMRLKAKIIATKPGHQSNIAFAKKIEEYVDANKHLLKHPVFDLQGTPILDINAIKEILPHAYPFLLVDKIIEMTDDAITGVKMVTYNEPFFPGHFPAEPIMPGVLQLEALAQAGGILAINMVDNPKDCLTYLLKMDNVKFRNKVGPGDALVLRLELMQPIRRGLCVMRGVAYVGNKIATEAAITAQIVKKQS